MSARTILLAAFIVTLCALPYLAQSKSRNGIGVGLGSHPVISFKPDPDWPKIDNKAEFTIVLRAIFRSNGKVTDIKFIEVKPEKPKDWQEKDIKEFAKRAADAARRIKFIPAQRDGHPVSLYMQLEYNFKLD